MLAVAAAETGMKQFVARVSNQSEAWLISEVPSPPLPEADGRVLPAPPRRHRLSGQAVVIPKRIRKIIDTNCRPARNHIVHRGVDPPSSEELRRLLTAVDEFLYTLDWSQGTHGPRSGSQELRLPDVD